MFNAKLCLQMATDWMEHIYGKEKQPGQLSIRYPCFQCCGGAGMVPRRVGAWWNAHVSKKVGKAWFCFNEGHRYRRDMDGVVAVLRALRCAFNGERIIMTVYMNRY